jgi:hypothetical protein
MFSLFRNPLMKLVGRFWWIPALAPFAGLGLGSEHGGKIAAACTEVYLALVAALTAMACAHGAVASGRWRASLRQRRCRFLCPHCLRLGGFRFACGSCGEEIEPFAVLTKGIYVNDCPHCKAALFGRPGQAEGIVRAYCGQCGQNADRVVHHERAVRIIGTFHGEDFLKTARAIGARQESAWDIGYACRDDGRELDYVVDIGELLNKPAGVPSDHAVRHLDVLWCDAAAEDPLKLGREVDRFVSLPEMPEERVRTVPVCIARDSLDPAAGSRLKALFDTIRYGVPPQELVEGAVAEEGPETPSDTIARARAEQQTEITQRAGR